MMKMQHHETARQSADDDENFSERSQDGELFSNNIPASRLAPGKFPVCLKHHHDGILQILSRLFQCSTLRVRAGQFLDKGNPPIAITLEDRSELLHGTTSV